jgi:hypothetical protein
MKFRKRRVKFLTIRRSPGDFEERDLYFKNVD